MSIEAVINDMTLEWDRFSNSPSHLRDFNTDILADRKVFRLPPGDKFTDATLQAFEKLMEKITTFLFPIAKPALDEAFAIRHLSTINFLCRFDILLTTMAIRYFYLVSCANTGTKFGSKNCTFDAHYFFAIFAPPSPNTMLKLTNWNAANEFIYTTFFVERYCIWKRMIDDTHNSYLYDEASKMELIPVVMVYPRIFDCKSFIHTGLVNAKNVSDLNETLMEELISYFASIEVDKSLWQFQVRGSHANRYLFVALTAPERADIAYDISDITTKYLYDNINARQFGNQGNINTLLAQKNLTLQTFKNVANLAVSFSYDMTIVIKPGNPKQTQLVKFDLLPFQPSDPILFKNETDRLKNRYDFKADVLNNLSTKLAEMVVIGSCFPILGGSTCVQASIFNTDFIHRIFNSQIILCNKDKLRRFAFRFEDSAIESELVFVSENGSLKFSEPLPFPKTVDGSVAMVQFYSDPQFTLNFKRRLETARFAIDTAYASNDVNFQSGWHQILTYYEIPLKTDVSKAYRNDYSTMLGGRVTSSAVYIDSYVRHYLAQAMGPSQSNGFYLTESDQIRNQAITEGRFYAENPKVCSPVFITNVPITVQQLHLSSESGYDSVLGDYFFFAAFFQTICQLANLFLYDNNAKISVDPTSIRALSKIQDYVFASRKQMYWNGWEQKYRVDFPEFDIPNSYDPVQAEKNAKAFLDLFLNDPGFMANSKGYVEKKVILPGNVYLRGLVPNYIAEKFGDIPLMNWIDEKWIRPLRDDLIGNPSYLWASLIVGKLRKIFFQVDTSKDIAFVKFGQGCDVSSAITVQYDNVKYTPTFCDLNRSIYNFLKDKLDPNTTFVSVECGQYQDRFRIDTMLSTALRTVIDETEDPVFTISPMGGGSNRPLLANDIIIGTLVPGKTTEWIELEELEEDIEILEAEMTPKPTPGKKGKKSQQQTPSFSKLEDIYDPNAYTENYGRILAPPPSALKDGNVIIRYEY